MICSTAAAEAAAWGVAHRLVGETHTKTKENTANVEHGQVAGSSIDGSSNGKPETSNDHAPLASNAGIQDVGHESSNSSCNQGSACSARNVLCLGLPSGLSCEGAMGRKTLHFITRSPCLAASRTGTASIQECLQPA